MKVYIAGPFLARSFLQGAARAIISHGYVVTSRWLTQAPVALPATGECGAAPELSEEDVALHVMMDLQDVRDADVLVVYAASALRPFPPERLVSGGRHVETGYALALGKPVIVVGAPENVFHRGVCTSVAGPSDVLDALRALARR